MGIISKPNTFSPSTTASSSQVNSNFDTIYNEFNGSIAAANLATDAVTTSKIADANVTLAKLASNSVDYSKVVTGIPVQVVSTDSTAVATGTTLIPLDDTIPQNTEGTEFITQAITPKSTTNILVIETNLVFAHSVIAHMCAALFQDSTANALAAVPVLEATANGALCIKLEHTMTAGTTSATTFKVRIGADTAGTTTFNGRAAGRLYGAITKSFIKITEYKA